MEHREGCIAWSCTPKSAAASSSRGSANGRRRVGSGFARETVRKMLRYATPPGYQRSKPARRPKLGPYTGIIDQILADDREQPRKQRYTAKSIHERLRDEYGFDGGYSSVKEYVREQRLTWQEMFVPLVRPAGDAQSGLRRSSRRDQRRSAQGAFPGR